MHHPNGFYWFNYAKRPKPLQYKHLERFYGPGFYYTFSYIVRGYKKRTERNGTKRKKRKEKNMARIAKQKVNHEHRRNGNTKDRSKIAGKHCAMDSQPTACEPLSRSNVGRNLPASYRKTLWTLAIVACVSGCAVNRVAVQTSFKGYPIRLEVDMGAGSKQAKTFWLRNLIADVKRDVDDRGVCRFPTPRQDGSVPLARIVELLGQRGIAVMELDNSCFAAHSAEALVALRDAKE